MGNKLTEDASSKAHIFRTVPINIVDDVLPFRIIPSMTDESVKNRLLNRVDRLHEINQRRPVSKARPSKTLICSVFRHRDDTITDHLVFLMQFVNSGETFRDKSGGTESSITSLSDLG